MFEALDTIVIYLTDAQIIRIVETKEFGIISTNVMIFEDGYNLRVI
jgi:hypothetical protein